MIDWKCAETAPKDGTLFLANLGYPWPLICAWCSVNEEWVYSFPQIDVAWSDENMNGAPYFESDWAKESKLRSWMPLPEVA